MHASWLLPLSHPLSPLSLLPLLPRLIHLHDLRLLPLFSRFSFSRDRALRYHLRAFSLSSLFCAVTALPFTLYALRSTSFLPAANFRASFSRDTTPVGCRGYTFIFVNFAFRFCGAGETVLREPRPTWKCNFAEPNPPDTDAALNADATATNWGGFISVRRGTARWRCGGREIGRSSHFSKYFARVGEKLRRNVIDSLCYSKELDRTLCTRVRRIVSHRTARSFLLLAIQISLVS